MFEPNEPVPPVLELTIEKDIPCRKCSYNLRGLSHAGQCPECGTAVELSLGGHLIRYSDPKWVAGLSKGVRLILWGLVVSIAAILLGRVAVLIGAVLDYWGSWLLTEPDPSALGEKEYGQARQIVRCTLLIGMVITFLDLAQSVSSPAPPVANVLATVAFLGKVADLVGWVAQLHYLQHLTARIPEWGLSFRARLLKKGIGWSYGIVLLLEPITSWSAAGGASRSSSLLTFLACPAMIAGVLLLVFSLTYLLLLRSLNKVLKWELAAAKYFWGMYAG